MPELMYGQHSEFRYDADPAEFEQGPPDDNNAHDPDFNRKPVEEKVRLWHEYLCKNMSQMSDAQIKKAWQASGMKVVAPAFTGLTRVAIQGKKVVPISMADYRMGPVDTSGRHQQYFDQLTPAQQRAAWANAPAAPAISPAARTEANWRSSLHQGHMDEHGVMQAIERFSVDGVADTGWSKKTLAAGIGIGGTIFAVLGAAASVSAWYFTKNPPGGTPNNAPNPPDGVMASACQSSVTVSWSPPSTGGADSYQLTLIEQQSQAQTTVSDIPTLIFTMQDMANGTYVAQVAAVNANGSSTPATSAAITVPGSGLVDFNAAVDQSTLAAALASFQTTTNLSHDDFWSAVIPICTVDEKGKPISYSDQLKLALYLALVLLGPVPPDPSLLDQYAAQIRSGAKPPFPATPLAANDPYINPVPLWTAASKLQNKLQTTVLPVRTQLCGLIRCLEVYLGIGPGDPNYV